MAIPSSGGHPGTLSTTTGPAGGGTAYASDAFGPTLFVDTNNGKDYYSGLTPSQALATMEQAFDLLETWQADTPGSSSNATINVIGDVREQLTAPLGVYGVKIVGLVNGNQRNTTNNGVEQAGDGVQWRVPASPAAGVPLLTLREQGWELHNIMMFPSAGISAVQLNRAENATDPDASHAVFRNVRFFGNAALGTAAGIGIEDVGGAYNVTVDGCQFINLVSGIYLTSAGIAAPLMWRVGVLSPNIFRLNTNDIATNASGWVIANNQFLTPYDVTTHPITCNLARTATTTYGNRVFNNAFADAAANTTIAKGYVKGNTSDVWRNFVTDTAAYIVAVPS